MTFIPEAPAEPAGPPWAKRKLDMRKLVGAFDATAEPPWLLEPLVIPGTLAVVAGQGGCGKTWVMHEAAHTVATGGRGRAGLQGRSDAGKALIIDAEMGEWLTVQRFAQQRYSLDIDVIDATGLNLSDAASRAELWDIVTTLAPDFIGWDSLAALTAGADENGKETGDLLNWVRNVHQTAPTKPAGLMVHHAGWKEERTRGSTTIRDRVDAVWYFKQSSEDEDVRELFCKGAGLKNPRWARPPDTQYMRLRPEGGLESTHKPESAQEVKQASDGERLRAALTAGEIKTVTDVERLLDLGYKAARGRLDKLGAHQVGTGRDSYWSVNGNGHPSI